MYWKLTKNIIRCNINNFTKFHVKRYKILLYMIIWILWLFLDRSAHRKLSRKIIFHKSYIIHILDLSISKNSSLKTRLHLFHEMNYPKRVWKNEKLFDCNYLILHFAYITILQLAIWYGVNHSNFPLVSWRKITIAFCDQIPVTVWGF